MFPSTVEVAPTAEAVAPGPDGLASAAAAGARLSRHTAAGLAAGLSVAGVFAVFSTALYLWALWMDDPLKSIGGLVPVVSLVLILRAWRSLGWTLRGTWWGLAILAATIAVVHVRDHAILELVLAPGWAIFLPPHSLVAVAWTAGCVLLFGGTRLLRRAVFPVCLMWLVNPVPHTFNLWVDLPLQHASAALARGFAHALGQTLTPDQLRLMFTPQFGMFIAPGCNGIRGAITMALLALVAGHVYRFRPRVRVLVTLAAMLLGYVFNLVRLCVLVLYYIVALHVRWLQPHAEMGDYIIGACLFFAATLLLFAVIRRFSPGGDLRPPALPEAGDEAARPAPRNFALRWLAMLALVAAGSVSYARALLHPPTPATGADVSVGTFPEQVGSWHRRRQWDEHLVTGALIFHWADYVSANSATVVSVGISPVVGAHDTLLCHAARGEDWLWHGDLVLNAAGRETSFSGSFFNDGATQYLEATTLCSGGRCGQFSSERRHFGLIYSRPDTRTLLSADPARPVPVLLRTETLDTAMAPDLARAQLTASLRTFVAGADLARFTERYR